MSIRHSDPLGWLDHVAAASPSDLAHAARVDPEAFRNLAETFDGLAAEVLRAVERLRAARATLDATAELLDPRGEARPN